MRPLLQNIYSMGKRVRKWMKTIREGIKKIMLWFTDWGITTLSKAELKLTKEDNPNPSGYDDLTPTSKGDEDKKYSKILEWALKNQNIKNIALTGSYGSGKSSIIKTFIKEHKEYNILNISLASFSDKDIAENEDINRLIELSIMQQMFYHVKHKQIPDSRFKRIRNLRTRSVIFKSLLLMVWLSAVVVFFKPNFITTFSLWQEYDLDNNKIASIIALCALTLGISYAVSKIFRIANNSKLNKLNVQSGEIEINHDVDSSILNKHLDEILYFFEVTKFDIVIIEDLDRFNNTEIFTKLRELNILVNHSKQIGRRIVFLYAIKDDMFQDKNRTKFFDFIIPVIPIINTSNSGEMLLNKFKEANLILEDETKDSLSIDFLSDVSMYIDDMRLLKNIYNEYVVYKEKLDPKLNQNNLLAMIIYKNIFPSDFVDLHNDKGNVFSIFNNKKELIKNRVDEINEEIKEARKKIQQIENVSVKDVDELRSIYIEAILIKVPNATSFIINGTEYQFEELKVDDVFSSLQECTTIQYKYLEKYGYNANQYRIQTNNATFNFESIEKAVDSEQTYEEREGLILDRDNNKIESSKQKIEKLEKEKHDIKSSSLLQIAEKIEISSVFKDIEKEKLIIYLIRNGYLNENYHDYISYFYEGLITKDDRDFLFSIKNRNALDFKFKLTKIDNLLRKIKPKEFEYKESLNFSLLDYLLANKNKYNTQYETLLLQICNKSRSSMLFIDTFLSEGINIDIFIQDLCEKWQSFWTHLTTTGYSDEKKEEYLKAIITHLSISEIKQQDIKSSLSNHIAGKNNFLSFVSGMEESKITSILKELNVKFTNLSQPEVGNKVFDFIYESNLYKINFDMIKLFVSSKGTVENTETLETKNYTTIISSTAKHLIKYINDNIQTYISNVFLQIPNNTKESTESVLSLLNNDLIKIEDRRKIVDISENKVHSLSSVENSELKEYLITTSAVSATWENIEHYFSLSEDTVNETLSEFVSNPVNYTELSTSKIKDSLGDKNPLLSKLSNAIIIDENITDDCFEAIISCFPYAYSPLDFADLSNQKIDVMIKNGYLQLSLGRYNYIKDNFDNNKHIDLLLRNSKKFLESEEVYSFDENDLIALLTSEVFNYPQKVDILLNTDKEVIKGSKQLCNQVCKIMANYQYVELETDLLLGIIANAQVMENRLKLLNIHIHSLSESSISTALNSLGEPYSDISIRGKKPSVPLNAATQILAHKLLEKGYVSSIKEKQEKIKINTFNA